MSKTTYRTWIYGELVTVSMMNEQIRDNGNAIWVGTAAGDMDYYTGAANKARLALGVSGQVIKAGAVAPGYGSPLSCSGSFTVATIGSLAETAWTDIAGATINLTVPGVSTLVAFASFEIIKQTSGSVFFRWMIDGTAQSQSKMEYHTGSISHPGSILGIKTSVAAGARTCKLQYYVSAQTATFQNILGIILGFAE